jgi:16S rRNA (guanine527-N7)-methyltransferase
VAEIEPATLLDRQLATLSLEVPPAARPRLIWLAHELLRWNRQVNLTSISTMDGVITKHLVDSLTLSPLLHAGQRMLDVGSGGGFPGLPLAIVDAELEVVSVDAVAKKINFQRHVARHLKLSNCQPLHCRVEDLRNWAGFDSGFDVVVSRAFSSVGAFVRLALPCLRSGGRMIAMKGPEGERELLKDGPLLEALGVVAVATKKLWLPNDGGERLLITLIRRTE